MNTLNVKEILTNYLAEGKILIAIDSNTDGVSLPDYLMNSIQVKLNLSYSFNTTVFEIDEEKVTIDLSFSGSRFLCVIPFTSIYYVAMSEYPLNGVEIIDNMPIELLELSYLLELEAEKNKEIKDKQIDFLDNISVEKATQIKKKIKVKLDKPEEKSFDDFMQIVSENKIRNKLKDISSKLHVNSEKKKIKNEINFTKYLNQLKNEK